MLKIGLKMPKMGYPQDTARWPRDGPKMVHTRQDASRSSVLRKTAYNYIFFSVLYGLPSVQDRPKIAARGFEGGPMRPQDGSKMAPNGPKMAPDGPRKAQAGPKMAPRWPKMAPGGPRKAQDGPKMAPR